MLKKLITCVVFATWLPAAFADPRSIKIFTTLAKADEIIDLQKADLPNTQIDVFFVDRKQDIISSMNSHIPAEQFLKWDDEERYEWGANYVKEVGPKKTLKIMKSTLGVSYMQMFEISRVPAILMDDYYVTYGQKLTQSVAEYNKL